MTTELFKTTFFDCPECGAELNCRVTNEAIPQCVNSPRVNCTCGHVVNRNRILALRICEQTREGVSFDCDHCGTGNYFPDPTAHLSCSNCNQPFPV